MGKTEIVENERVNLFVLSFKVYVNSVYCSLDKNMICNGIREEIPGKMKNLAILSINL